MTRLSDYGYDVYSATGVDGIVTEVMRRIGTGGKIAVEFGAGDGISCSNTANLWRNQGWSALLIEADPTLYGRLAALVESLVEPHIGPPNVRTLGTVVEASGIQSIDSILDFAGIREVDFMSCDVDGDDLWIVAGMVARPRLLCVEFNPTIPPHLDVQPRGPGNRMGVGVVTLRRTMEQRGYAFIGLADVNAFFVRAEDAYHFTGFVTDLAVLMPPERFTYLATDYTGRMVPLGSPPPWGLLWPPSETTWRPNTAGLLEVEDSRAPLAGPLLAELRALRRENELAIEALRILLDARLPPRPPDES